MTDEQLHEIEQWKKESRKVWRRLRRALGVSSPTRARTRKATVPADPGWGWRDPCEVANGPGGMS